MKTIGIIGLGLIGGSMAKTIRTNTKYRVYGLDANPDVIKLAIEQNIVYRELNHENAKDCDCFIIALYPKDIFNVVREYAKYMKKGTLLVDCTGVKKIVHRELSAELKDMGIYFIGGHPMAGKEVAGYLNADNSLYDNASMILCRDEYTDEGAYNEAVKLFKEIGFPRIKESTPEEHDQVIAFTSQMAHVVSNAYVKSPTLHERYGFSAGSFKDLTRVAKLNEYMWADLFLANREALISELDIFVKNINKYQEALEAKDKDGLISLLREGRELKELDIERDNNAKNS